MIDPFVSLHNHTEYSFLDGRQTVPMSVRRAVELNQSALASTDHGECSSHVEFEKVCKENGVKPIFGMEGYLVHSVLEHRELKQQAQKEIGHIILLAMNQTGLKNLWTLSTLGYKQKYYKPVCDWENFKQFNEGLIATDACLLSWMARAILEDNDDKVKQLIGRYRETFGDRFFMELHTWQYMDPKTEEDLKWNRDMSRVNQAKVEIAREHGIPLIVVNDSHYDCPEEWVNHDLVWAMSTNSDQSDRGQTASHMMGSEEVIHWMSKHGVPRSVTEEAISNTAIIAEVCNVEIPKDLKLPSLMGTPKADMEHFFDLVEEGYQRKYVATGRDTQEARDRRDHEIEQIVTKGFYGYFNIVSDYCKFAKGKGEGTPWEGKKKPWLVGPSRGSAGGSLVAYCMDIIELCPLEYNVPFARFIDPGRKNFPDIDLDFPQSQRHVVKDYLRWKYGNDRVALIGNFSTLGPKALVADLGRAMLVPYDDCKRMSKIINEVKDIETTNVEVSWEDILKDKGSELVPWMNKYPTFFTHFQQLLGLKRQSGTHAAGILISPYSLLGLIPMRVNSDGEYITQFEMNTVEQLGFIKFDVLGIRHLDTMMLTDELVNGEHDPNRFYHMTREQYEDPVVWEMVGRGENLGIFTLETSGMTLVARKIKPKNEKMVAHIVAINRPGVLRAGGMEKYINRASGKEPFQTPHPMVDEITRETFGVLVFQDQVMEVTVKCAGFSLIEADKVRKIMGKMLHSEMIKIKDEFIARCLANPEFVRKSIYFPPDVAARKLWAQMEPAGIYSFNIAHAQGYAFIATWGAYLKAHYFKEHMVSLMVTDTSRVTWYLKELRRKDYKILPPDINESKAKFSIAPDGIRYGLDSVKQVGSSSLAEIFSHRPFTSLSDAMERCSGRSLRANVLMNLIYIGAFDSVATEEQWALARESGLHIRSVLTEEFYRIRKTPEKDRKKIPSFSETELFEIEKELVGTFVSVDPMMKYSDEIESKCISHPDEIEERKVGELVHIGGQITNIRLHQSKKPGRNFNRWMAFITVTYEEQPFDVTAFYDSYQQSKPLIQVGAPVVMTTERLEQGVSLLRVKRLDYTKTV